MATLATEPDGFLAQQLSFAELEVVDNPYLYAWTKRAFDLIVGLVILLPLLPLMLLMAALIKLDSTGPVLFIQRRLGSKRYGRGKSAKWTLRSFSFLKFRSMFQDADETTHRDCVRRFVNGKIDPSSLAIPNCKLNFKPHNDRRVTRIGKFLRKSSCDELPQILNVLRGEMSIVGPRPVPLYEAALYQCSDYERLAALPGITGPWQVGGRTEVPFTEMMRMDIDYVRTANLWTDIKIMVLTVPAVLSGRGAK